MVFAPGRPETVAVFEKPTFLIHKTYQKQYKNIAKSSQTFKTNTPPFGIEIRISLHCIASNNSSNSIKMTAGVI